MKEKKKTIALSGGFDPPTRGQIAMIQEAAQLGDVIIILNSDKWCAERREKKKNSSRSSWGCSSYPRHR